MKENTRARVQRNSDLVKKRRHTMPISEAANPYPQIQIGREILTRAHRVHDFLDPKPEPDPNNKNPFDPNLDADPVSSVFLDPDPDPIQSNKKRLMIVILFPTILKLQIIAKNPMIFCLSCRMILMNFLRYYSCEQIFCVLLLFHNEMKRFLSKNEQTKEEMIKHLSYVIIFSQRNI